MDNLSAITIYTHGHGVRVRVRVRVRLEEFCQEADRGKEIMARQGEQAGKTLKIMHVIQHNATITKYKRTQAKKY